MRLKIYFLLTENFQELHELQRIGKARKCVHRKVHTVDFIVRFTQKPANIIGARKFLHQRVEVVFAGVDHRTVSRSKVTQIGPIKDRTQPLRLQVFLQRANDTKNFTVGQLRQSQPIGFTESS